MRLQQWILLFAGLVIIFGGVCLMAYSVVAKRAFAGARKQTGSKTAEIINALAGLLKGFGDFIGANQAGRVGFVLVLVGFGLLYLALLH